MVGKLQVVTGPVASGKTTHLRNLCPDYWIVPAMEISRADAESFGAIEGEGLFVWPMYLKSPSKICSDEPDGTLGPSAHAVRYANLLRNLCAAGHDVHVATHMHDIAELATSERFYVKYGGLMKRQYAALLTNDHLLRQGVDSPSMSLEELIYTWQALPFIDARQGCGLIFNMMPPGLQSRSDWILIPGWVYEVLQERAEES